MTVHIAGALAPPGLISAYRFHPDAPPETLDPDAPIAPGPGFLWLHANLADTRFRDWIAGLEILPEEARDSLVEPDDDQALHVAEGCLHGVVVDLVQEFSGPTEQIGYLHFALTEGLVVTGRRQSLQAPEALRRSLGRDMGRDLGVETPADLFQALVEGIADGFDRVADRISRTLDRIEDRVLADQLGGETATLGRLRLTVVRLHRRLAGLRTLFHRLESGRQGLLPRTLRLAAGDLAQRFDVLDHEIVALQARARLIQEEMSAKIAADTNRNLYVLSLVTALLLPPSLVAGIFGMNTRGLPFAEQDGGFWGALALVAASAAAVFWVLKRRSLVGGD